MALRMASPWKHPKTGVYWFRRRVPDALRPFVGKTILQRTLDTKIPAEAKGRFLTVAAQIDREWARLAMAAETQAPPPDKLSPKQIHGIAGQFYRWLVAKHENDPGRADAWLAEIEQDKRWINPRGPRPSGAGALYRPQVETFLAECGIILSDSDLFSLSYAAAQAGVLAKERIVRMAKRDWSADPAEAKFPKWADVEPTLNIPGRMLTLDEDFDEAMKTKKVSTRKRYRGCLNDLERFLGTRDLGTATPERIQDWVDDLASRMVGEGDEARRVVADKTIKESHLAAARSFYGWAVTKKKLRSNPALDIYVDVREPPKLRQPYFTDEERNLILSETLREPSGRESPEFKAAKRWIPWLCAYTGARVNEITQLRGQDFKERRTKAGEIVWTIKITPEAGSQKTDEAREVPLHPHLIEQGFPEYAKSRGLGPLFYNPDRRRGGSDENPQYAKVGEKLADWVRRIGVPRGVAPNHGWRHHFTAIARRVDMRPEIRDGITGHKPRTEGEAYGGFIEWDMMWPAINLLPRWEVAAATGPLVHTDARKKATKDRAATRKRAKERAKAAKAAE